MSIQNDATESDDYELFLHPSWSAVELVWISTGGNAAVPYDALVCGRTADGAPLYAAASPGGTLGNYDARDTFMEYMKCERASEESCARITKTFEILVARQSVLVLGAWYVPHPCYTTSGVTAQIDTNNLLQPASTQTCIPLTNENGQLFAYIFAFYRSYEYMNNSDFNTIENDYDGKKFYVGLKNLSHLPDITWSTVDSAGVETECDSYFHASINDLYYWVVHCSSDMVIMRYIPSLFESFGQSMCVLSKIVNNNVGLN